MRRISMVAGLALAVTVLAGCPPTYPKCNSDETCQAQNANEVCVNGTCQECATDANCKEGFACQENKCVPKGPECSRDEQCTGGKICEAGKCAEPQCTSKAQCQGAQECQKGRCALPPGACDSSSDCGGDQECQQNKCVSARKSECDWEPLRFAFNEASLTSEAQGRLGELAQCIRESSVSGTIEVAGHADERGTEEFNLQLSQRRAAAVKKYLVDLGVAANRLKTVGYGENRPIEQGSGEDVWAANRRVEFVR